jgi:hypothetical protein
MPYRNVYLIEVARVLAHDRAYHGSFCLAQGAQNCRCLVSPLLVSRGALSFPFLISVFSLTPSIHVLITRRLVFPASPI